MMLALILGGLFGLAAIAVLILAIRESYRIERMKKPDLPRPRLTYTNIFASAFGAPPSDEARKARERLNRLLLATLGLLGASAAASIIGRSAGDPLANIHASDFLPEGAYLYDPGTTLLYTRSNQNGSLPERILMHVVSDREVHVAKMVEACKSAAYVTAVFDPRTGEPTRLVGGRLGRDSKQQPQAWLNLDTKTRQLSVRVEGPKSDPAETHTAPPAPWRIYDFDFAEYALYGPRLGQPWTFGLAMAWPDSKGILKILGAADGQPMMETVRLGRPVAMYAVTGEAFGGPDGEGGGIVTIDVEYGSIIEARLGRPNHQGYDDFLLKLDYVVHGEDGVSAWNYELAAHWAGCPTEPAGQ